MSVRITHFTYSTRYSLFRSAIGIWSVPVRPGGHRKQLIVQEHDNDGAFMCKLSFHFHSTNACFACWPPLHQHFVHSQIAQQGQKPNSFIRISTDSTRAWGMPINAPDRRTVCCPGMCVCPPNCRTSSVIARNRKDYVSMDNECCWARNCQISGEKISVHQKDWLATGTPYCRWGHVDEWRTTANEATRELIGFDFACYVTHHVGEVNWNDCATITLP